MIEEIKALYEQVTVKYEFFKELSNAVDRRPNTIRTHWFSNANFWAIPEDLQPKVLETLKNYLENQKATA